MLFATRRRWHHQWFEAREVAERLRIVAPAWLLGAWPSQSEAGASGLAGLVRARDRARTAAVLRRDRRSPDEIRDILAALVDEQLAYHVANAERLERRDHVFEGVGVGLLAASLGNNALYLAARFFDASGLERYRKLGPGGGDLPAGGGDRLLWRAPVRRLRGFGAPLAPHRRPNCARSRRASSARWTCARCAALAEAATRAMLSDLDALAGGGGEPPACRRAEALRPRRAPGRRRAAAATPADRTPAREIDPRRQRRRRPDRGPRRRGRSRARRAGPRSRRAASRAASEPSDSLISASRASSASIKRGRVACGREDVGGGRAGRRGRSRR